MFFLITGFDLTYIAAIKSYQKKIIQNRKKWNLSNNFSLDLIDESE